MKLGRKPYAGVEQTAPGGIIVSEGLSSGIGWVRIAPAVHTGDERPGSLLTLAAADFGP